MDTTQGTLRFQLVQIAAHCFTGHAEMVGELLHAHGALTAQKAEDPFVSLRGQKRHGKSLFEVRKCFRPHVCGFSRTLSAFICVSQQWRVDVVDGSREGYAGVIAPERGPGYSCGLLCVSTPAWFRVEAAQLHGHMPPRIRKGSYGPGLSSVLT
ncbi:hypothetical protein GCM10009771_09250 [Nesterenkonia flava]